MPEHETSVRLCFGSETVPEGFAASNTRDNSGSMPEWQNRTLKAGACKKAEFYPEQLSFHGGNGQVTLSDWEGSRIYWHGQTGDHRVRRRQAGGNEYP